MSGFWSSETLNARLPELDDPYDGSRVVNCAYALSMEGQYQRQDPGRFRGEWSSLHTSWPFR